ncbi:uncharacterized protein ACA1_389390 [Acanthamoeba castellanii str. Neff]|uniref:Uncharacterized protein n=1 Tax=Acanthamoeba castellanii (strain ATCC 30010 / Neff) TaxID=1257118 RepID=L8GER7_ACACF|nr:uncharacterized protein ACA1_389390 [Acanthamoeba castellanii str. Neff]ELR11218.1 hypothetical protein ACA1_389390 [Acanthamoeba castellanii str. Neff]
MLLNLSIIVIDTAAGDQPYPYRTMCVSSLFLVSPVAKALRERKALVLGAATYFVFVVGQRDGERGEPDLHRRQYCLVMTLCSALPCTFPLKILLLSTGLFTATALMILLERRFASCPLIAQTY